MTVEIDKDEGRYLTIVFETGHRITISLDHNDGMELHSQLAEYYGKIEMNNGNMEVKTERFEMQEKKPGIFKRIWGAIHG